MYQIIAMMAISAIMSQQQGSGNRFQMRLQNSINDANTEAGNKVRRAQNANTAAQGNLARWVQSVQNNRRLDAGGRALEELATNANRAADERTAGQFAQSIRSAEAAGMSAAQMALNGVGGSVVDMINHSTALREQIGVQQMERATALANYDVGRRAGAIAGQMVSSLDNSILLDQINYGEDVAKHSYANSAGYDAAVAAMATGLQYAMTSSGSSGKPETGSATGSTDFSLTQGTGDLRGLGSQYGQVDTSMPLTSQPQTFQFRTR